MMTPLGFNDNDNATPHANPGSSVGASLKFPPPVGHERAHVPGRVGEGGDALIAASGFKLEILLSQGTWAACNALSNKRRAAP